jgi:Fe-S-cluster containining protein
MLVANVVGKCPNLLPNGLCGVYEDRPLVCRIYPAEINPFVNLRRENKLCPPEAWTSDRPLLQRSGTLTDEVTQHNIELSRSADSQDAQLKSRLCAALNIADAALVHEAVLVYSPTAATLLSALTIALANDAISEPASQWRYVSDQPEVLANLTRHGAIALPPGDTKASAFQHLQFRREAIFSFDAGVEG